MPGEEKKVNWLKNIALASVAPAVVGGFAGLTSTMGDMDEPDYKRDTEREKIRVRIDALRNAANEIRRIERAQ